MPAPSFVASRPGIICASASGQTSGGAIPIRPAAATINSLFCYSEPVYRHAISIRPENADFVRRWLQFVKDRSTPANTCVAADRHAVKARPNFRVNFK
jgi:sulfur relay (sulfurtransferase) complex TusBCD TusD component (DsrE family)